MLVPLLLLVAVGAFVAVKLHRHRLDPLIDRVLYRAGLNNLKTIQRRVIARTSAEVKASITTTYMPTDVSVGLSSDAFEEIEPLLGHVVVDLKEEINRVAKERGFKLLAPPKVRIYGDPQLTPGAVHVNTQIAEGTRHVTPRLASIGSPHRPLLGIPDAQAPDGGQRTAVETNALDEWRSSSPVNTRAARKSSQDPPRPSGMRGSPRVAYAGPPDERVVRRVVGNEWRLRSRAVGSSSAARTRPAKRPRSAPKFAAAGEGHEKPPVANSGRQAFGGFVGNEAAVRRLLPWLAVALRARPPRLPENIAFTGPASTGKTELARRLAAALGLPLLSTSGSGIRSLDDLLERMERCATDAGHRFATLALDGGQPVRRFPPLAVFVDEAHELRRPVQEQLLTLLDPRERRARGSRFVADALDVTFMFATTDWGDLISTFQSRLQRVPLKSYSLEQVTEMVSDQHPDWSGQVCRQLAVAGRQMPRAALQKARELTNATEALPGRGVEVLLKEYFELWRLDDLGIDSDDRRYLNNLNENRGPMGLDRIANRIRLGEREIGRGIEPYLEALELIEIGPRGRELTERGREYLRSFVQQDVA